MPGGVDDHLDGGHHARGYASVGDGEWVRKNSGIDTGDWMGALDEWYRDRFG